MTCDFSCTTAYVLGTGIRSIGTYLVGAPLTCRIFCLSHSSCCSPSDMLDDDDGVPGWWWCAVDEEDFLRVPETAPMPLTLPPPTPTPLIMGRRFHRRRLELFKSLASCVRGGRANLQKASLLPPQYRLKNAQLISVHHHLECSCYKLTLFICSRAASIFSLAVLRSLRSACLQAGVTLSSLASRRGYLVTLCTGTC